MGGLNQAAIEDNTDRGGPSAIRSLHWDEPRLELPIPWTPGSGRVLAIWPAPIDHDACFAAAGFVDFADSNPGWDAEFRDLLRSLLHFLERTGQARLQTGEYPAERGAFAWLAHWVGPPRATPNLDDALLAAARDDRFPPCVVQFGDPVRASVRSSSGHPLLWVWSAPGGPDREQLLSSVAGDRPVVNTPLDWNALT